MSKVSEPFVAFAGAGSNDYDRFVSFYPLHIGRRFKSPLYAVAVNQPDACARAASFECGSMVEFSLGVQSDAGSIEDVSFRSNGCGYMIAAADVISEIVDRQPLSGMNGLASDAIVRTVEAELGKFPADRRHCLTTCIEGLHSAFAVFRSARIEEFRGEKALVCTCFGLSDDDIELIVADRSIGSVDDVAQRHKAGSGCGSCRMLIQEMLDNRGEIEKL